MLQSYCELSNTYLMMRQLFKLFRKKGGNTMDEKRDIPIVNLHGIVVFPGSLIHFDVFDEQSQNAIKAAMNKEQLIFVSMVEEQGQEKSNYIGTVSKVKYYISLPNDTIRVLVEGVDRGRLLRIVDSDGAIVEAYDLNDFSFDDNTILYGDIGIIKDEGEKLLSFYEKEALLRTLKELFIRYANEVGTLGQETINRISSINNLRELIDEVTINISLLDAQTRQILVTLDVINRHEKLSKFMSDEIEIIKIKKDYQIKVKEKIDKNQKEYLLREQLKIIQSELGEEDTNYIDEYQIGRAHV